MRVDFGPLPFDRTVEDNVGDNRSTLLIYPAWGTELFWIFWDLAQQSSISNLPNPYLAALSARY